MATTAASYRKTQPQSPTFVERVHNYLESPRVETKPVKFDADFLERRMQAHREQIGSRGRGPRDRDHPRSCDRAGGNLMTLPTERFPQSTHQSVGGCGDGELLDSGGRTVAVLDSQLYQDMRWCPNCAGPQLFIPVDRFPFGWRGYCLGCEEVGYVLDERTSEEAA